MRRFIFSSLFFCFPFLVIVIIALLLPTTPRQRKDYLYASIMKDSLLMNTSSPRLILIGGSNLSFGLNCQLIKDSLNVNPVNMGLHADIGLKYMLDSSLPLLRDGDIVLVIPEYEQFFNNVAYGATPLVEVVFNVKSMSLGKEVKQKIDNLSKLNYIQYNQLVKYSVPYILSKVDVREYSNHIIYSPYRSNAFNAYGDIISHWNDSINTYNIELVKRNVSGINIETAKLLKDFYTQASNKNVRVYISFPAIYDKSFEWSANYIKRVVELMEELNIPIIGDPYTNKVSQDYLFDTHYHLNKKGADIRTKTLIEDIKSILH